MKSAADYIKFAAVVVASILGAGLLLNWLGTGAAGGLMQNLAKSVTQGYGV